MVSLRDKCFAILSIFETSQPFGGYDTIATAKGDKGGLSYGKHQASINSGNLFLLCEMYASTPDSTHGKSFAPYLPLLKRKSTDLGHNREFLRLLKASAADPVMQACQENFFERQFFIPACKFAESQGLKLPLSTLVIFDSWVHGSLKRLFATVPDSFETEKLRITGYVRIRKEWLASQPTQILRRTVYRTEAFLNLIKENNWNLDLPFSIRGQLLTESDFR